MAKITIPEDKIGSPLDNLPIQRGNKRVPNDKIGLPLDNLIPGGNKTVPNDKIGLPLENVMPNEPGRNKTVPNDKIGLPLDNKKDKEDKPDRQAYSGPGSIEYLKSTIKTGLARPNRYVVQIVFPSLTSKQAQSNWAPIVKGAIGANGNSISVLCESVELPGLHYATVEDKLWGPIRKMPYLPTYNDLSLVFMCDKEMKIRFLFDQWQSMIAAKDYKFETYYDEFVAEVFISLLPETNAPEPVYTIKCTEAYPIEIVSQTCSYGDIDTYLKMEVKMAYHFYDHSDLIPALSNVLNAGNMTRPGNGSGQFKL